MDAGLIDRIYESAFAPEFWPNVLDELATLCDARGGMLIAGNSEAAIPVWTSSKNFWSMTGEYFRGELYRRGRATKSLLASRHAGFLRDTDTMTLEDMEADPLYRDLLWPAGLGNAVGTTISMPTGDVLMCILHRERARGPVESAAIARLDALRPHLARSALMSARLRLERARAAVEGLDILGLPALAFGFDGHVVAANASIQAETAHVRWGARDRVALRNKPADVLFQRALESLGVDDRRAVRSFAIRDADAAAARVAHVVPIRGVSRDIFARAAGVLMLTPVTTPQAPGTELIQSLFDLTPAEARVARGLTGGETLQRIAAGAEVSTHTVRTHLQSVLKKTGCRRQAEVVALLGGLVMPGGGPRTPET